MAAHPASAPAPETRHNGDFELVRNAEGSWLLIVNHLPAAMIDNPLGDISLCVEEVELVLVCQAQRHSISHILSSHYVRALREDRPAYLLLSIVNDEGMQTFSRKVAVVFK